MSTSSELRVSAGSLDLTYDLRRLMFHISYGRVPLVKNGHVDLLINGERAFPLLRYHGHEVTEEDEWYTVKVEMEHPLCRVEHHMMLSRSGDALVSWLSVHEARRRVVLREASPLVTLYGDLLPLWNIDICHKEFWAFPLHFSKKYSQILYTPIVFCSREDKSCAVIASLTSEFGKARLKTSVEGGYPRVSLDTLLDHDRVVLDPGGLVELDKVVFLLGKSPVEVLERYADLVLEFNKAKRPLRVDDFPLRCRGWISFGYYYTKISQDIIEREAEFVASKLRQYGYGYVVIDDGWQRRDTAYPSAYDWIANSRTFPRGVASTVKRLHEMGLKAVLWVSFTVFDKTSHLIEERPDMFIKAGGEVYVDRLGRAYMNVMSEDAREYLEKLFETYKSWGVDALTFDIGTFSYITPSLEFLEGETLTTMKLYNEFMDYIDDLAAKHGLGIMLKACPDVPSVAKFRNAVSVRVSADVTYRSTEKPQDIARFADVFFKECFWSSKLMPPDPDALITGQQSWLIHVVWSLVSSRRSVVYYGDPAERARLDLLALYPVYDAPARPLTSTFMETPPSVLVAEMSIGGWKPIKALGLLNLRGEAKKFSIDLNEIGVKYPALACDLETRDVEEVEERLDLQLDEWSAKLIHIVEREEWPALPIFISGYAKAKISTADANRLELALEGDPLLKTLILAVLNSPIVAPHVDGKPLKEYSSLEQLISSTADGYVRVGERMVLLKVPSAGRIEIRRRG